MEEIPEDSKNKVPEEFELKSELSALVTKNVIPKRVAEKLEHKLKESQVKISKENLDLLVSKIREVMHDYVKFGQYGGKNKMPDAVQLSVKKTESDADMKKLFDSLKELRENHHSREGHNS